MLSGRIFTCYITCSDAQLYPTLCDPMDCSTASLCFTISWSLSIGSVIPSNHLILCCSLLLLASIFPSIRVFSSESALHIRWPKYWSFSFSISPSNQYSGLISLQSKRLSRVVLNTTVQKILKIFIYLAVLGLSCSMWYLIP